MRAKAHLYKRRPLLIFVYAMVNFAFFRYGGIEWRGQP